MSVLPRALVRDQALTSRCLYFPGCDPTRLALWECVLYTLDPSQPVASAAQRASLPDGFCPSSFAPPACLHPPSPPAAVVEHPPRACLDVQPRAIPLPSRPPGPAFLLCPTRALMLSDGVFLRGHGVAVMPAGAITARLAFGSLLCLLLCLLRYEHDVQSLRSRPVRTCPACATSSGRASV